MSYFITRVELHEATWADYESLHSLMAAQGFGRTVQADSGVQYQLPPAEYLKISAESPNAVLEAAARAAAATGRNASVLVTEGQRLVWQGLPQL